MIQNSRLVNLIQNQLYQHQLMIHSSKRFKLFHQLRKILKVEYCTKDSQCYFEIEDKQPICSNSLKSKNLRMTYSLNQVYLELQDLCSNSHLHSWGNLNMMQQSYRIYIALSKFRLSYLITKLKNLQILDNPNWLKLLQPLINCRH